MNQLKRRPSHIFYCSCLLRPAQPVLPQREKLHPKGDDEPGPGPVPLKRNLIFDRLNKSVHNLLS